MALNLTLNTTNTTEAKFVNSDHPNGIDLTEIKYKKGSGGSAVTVWKKNPPRPAVFELTFVWTGEESHQRQTSLASNSTRYPYASNSNPGLGTARDCYICRIYDGVYGAPDSRWEDNGSTQNFGNIGSLAHAYGYPFSGGVNGYELKLIDGGAGYVSGQTYDIVIPPVLFPVNWSERDTRSDQFPYHTTDLPRGGFPYQSNSDPAPAGGPKGRWNTDIYKKSVNGNSGTNTAYFCQSQGTKFDYLAYNPDYQDQASLDRGNVFQTSTTGVTNMADLVPGFTENFSPRFQVLSNVGSNGELVMPSRNTRIKGNTASGDANFKIVNSPTTNDGVSGYSYQYRSICARVQIFRENSGTTWQQGVTLDGHIRAGRDPLNYIKFNRNVQLSDPDQYFQLQNRRPFTVQCEATI